jgi:hypothetical protein
MLRQKQKQNELHNSRAHYFDPTCQRIAYLSEYYNDNLKMILLCKKGQRSFIPDTINSIGAELISLYLVIHSPRQKQFQIQLSGLHLTFTYDLMTLVHDLKVTARILLVHSVGPFGTAQILQN